MNKTMLLVAGALLLLSACGNDGKPSLPPHHRGVYHWKTTYNPTDWERQWMKEHRVDRLYIKLFDVEPGWSHGYPDWKAVPVATTEFKQRLPEDMEVIPVVYITVDAVREFADDFVTDELKWRYARLIVRRIDDMMGDHWSGTVREVQLDCDWTRFTEQTYFALVRCIKELLHQRGIELSGTLRLHQLPLAARSAEAASVDDALPFDRSLLMCYNTGRLQDQETDNSILDYDDAKPYLRRYRPDSLARTDVAWPVYGWGVEFGRSGSFVRLVNSRMLPSALKSRKERQVTIREEWGDPHEIRRTQRALPMLDALHTTILYHLDSLNLSKYSHEDIEAFYSR